MTIDLTSAIALYLIIAVVLVMAGWIFYNWGTTEKPLAEQQQFLEQCPYCTFVFFDYNSASIKICPGCKSYITNEDQKT